MTMEDKTYPYRIEPKGDRPERFVWACCESVTEDCEHAKKYRVDVLAIGEPGWATNALRFDTVEEAEAYGRDLFMRWMMVDKMSVVGEDVPDRLPYVEGERRLLRG